MAKYIRYMNWDYIAGFFEGEGCLHLDKRNCVHITISQKKYPEILRKISQFLKLCGVDNVIDRRRELYVLRVRGLKSKIFFLSTIYRYVQSDKLREKIQSSKELCLRKAKHKHPTPSLKEREKIFRLYMDGATIGEIAKVYGVTSSVVYGIILSMEKRAKNPSMKRVFIPFTRRDREEVEAVGGI